MCLVAAWLTGFLARRSAPWLSICNTIGPEICSWSSVRRWWSQTNSFVASAAAMYSACVEEVVMVNCCLDIQETAPRVKEGIPWYGVVVRAVICPVGISISNQFTVSHHVHNTMVGASCQVLHNVLEALDMIMAESCCKWCKCSNGGADVGVL